MKDEKKLGKFVIVTNMRSDPKDAYELYKLCEEMEVAFDAMKNELETDKTYIRTKDDLRVYFFVSLISLYIYFRILGTLTEKDLLNKISVNEALF